jgi:hypothetical protein
MAAINRLSDEKPKDSKLGYKLGRIVADCQAEFKYLSTAQTDLLEKYYEQSEANPDQMVIKDRSKLKEYRLKREEILDLQTGEIWGDPWQRADLDGQILLSIKEYAALGWLIKDNEADAEVTSKAKASGAQ